MSTPDLETATWRKSSHSGTGGDCIEVADGFPGVVPIRDSKAPGGPRLIVGSTAWSSFVHAVKSGEFAST